jgi:CheY-like chemotaxis protein
MSVLTDINMPVMDGLTLLSKINETQQQILGSYCMPYGMENKNGYEQRSL